MVDELLEYLDKGIFSNNDVKNLSTSKVATSLLVVTGTIEKVEIQCVLFWRGHLSNIKRLDMYGNFLLNIKSTDREFHKKFTETRLVPVRLVHSKIFPWTVCVYSV